MDAPVFTPPSLVVAFGALATANCTVCEKDCLGTVFGLEHAIGNLKRNGTSISWEVNSLTEWATSLLCYYNRKGGGQCSKTLHITLYSKSPFCRTNTATDASSSIWSQHGCFISTEPPDRVSVSFRQGHELLLEGESYFLECVIENIAPLKHLIVTFYKGPEALAQMYFNSSQEPKPVNKVSVLKINVSKEDDGAQYWCDARLNLDVQQVPLTVSSQKLNATVYCEYCCFGYFPPFFIYSIVYETCYFPTS